MARLDMSDAFDPDFMDPCTCTRTAQIVGSNGRTVNTPTVIPFLAVVTNDNGDVLQRDPNATRVIASINVISLMQLRMENTDCDADVITWNGAAYTVTGLKDYATYGAGFSIATCAILQPTG